MFNSELDFEGYGENREHKEGGIYFAQLNNMDEPIDEVFIPFMGGDFNNSNVLTIPMHGKEDQSYNLAKPKNEGDIFRVGPNGVTQILSKDDLKSIIQGEISKCIPNPEIGSPEVDTNDYKDTQTLLHLIVIAIDILALRYDMQSITIEPDKCVGQNELFRIIGTNKCLILMLRSKDIDSMLIAEVVATCSSLCAKANWKFKIGGYHADGTS